MGLWRDPAEAERLRWIEGCRDARTNRRKAGVNAIDRDALVLPPSLQLDRLPAFARDVSRVGGL